MAMAMGRANEPLGSQGDDDADEDAAGKAEE